MNNETTPWVDPADEQLTELLAAAGAPGTDAELRNEEHSVVMFQMTHLESLTARRIAMSPTPRTQRITARTIAASIAAFTLTTAGIALAATGNLPGNALGNGQGIGTGDDEVGSSQVVESQAVDEDDQGEDEQGDSSSDAVTDEVEGEDSAESTPDDTEDSTSLGFRGLCRAITVGNKAEHGTALEAPPFVALVEAAGGIENVKAYCTEQFGVRTHPVKPEHPEHPDKPSKPAHPSKPEHPTKPDHPGKPDNGVRPDKQDRQRHEHQRGQHAVRP